MANKRRSKKLEEEQEVTPPAEAKYEPAKPRPVPPGLARLRLPDAASPEAAYLADRAMQRVEDVLEERVHPTIAPSVLKAAQMIRDEHCGPIPKDINVRGLSLQDLVRAANKPDEEDSAK